MPKGIYKRTKKHLNSGCFTKGHIMSDEIRQKIRKTLTGRKRVVAFGEFSPNWRGDMVGYRGIHSWIEKTFGKPNRCEECKNKGDWRYEWSNLSGKYKRQRSDWERLCVYCHRIKDFKKAKERKQNGIFTK